MTGTQTKAWIGLGSNLGDRRAALTAARGALADSQGLVVVAASSIYETDPVGPAGQGPYLNAVLEIETLLASRPLLERLLRVERELGRDRDTETARWGPRTIDLDLLLHADRCIDEAGLVVPHPRLHERTFVLVPLAELAGERAHPRLGGRVLDWLSRRPDRETARSYEGIGPADWAPPPRRA